jgi:uncharacterized coiled-coil DUF342 family protein
MNKFSDYKSDLQHEKNRPLFQMLNEQATNLRSKAKEMAVFLNSLNSQNIEIKELMEGMQKVATMPIEEIDRGIDELRKDFLKLSLNTDKKSSYIHSFTPEKLALFFKKQEDLTEEAVLFVGKVFDLVKEYD